MDLPFAITLDVGSSRANKTGSWRTERAVYVELHAHSAYSFLDGASLPEELDEIYIRFADLGIDVVERCDQRSLPGRVRCRTTPSLRCRREQRHQDREHGERCFLRPRRRIGAKAVPRAVVTGTPCYRHPVPPGRESSRT